MSTRLADVHPWWCAAPDHPHERACRSTTRVVGDEDYKSTSLYLDRDPIPGARTVLVVEQRWVCYDPPPHDDHEGCSEDEPTVIFLLAPTEARQFAAALLGLTEGTA